MGFTNEDGECHKIVTRFTKKIHKPFKTKDMKILRMFIAMLMISASTVMMAQPQGRQHQQPTQEQMQEMMWKRVSAKLMLSDAQTEKVKPIYLAYLAELQEIAPKRGQMVGQQKPKEKTEADIKAEMKQKFANERKKLDIQERYFDKFSKELNARQAQYLVQSANRSGRMQRGMHGMRFGNGRNGAGMRGMNRGNNRMPVMMHRGNHNGGQTN